MQNNKFPSDWQKLQLKEICSNIFSGGTPSTKDETYWNGTILWLSSGEIKKRYIISSNQKITQAGIDNSSTKLAKKDDVLIASAGQGNTRGNVAFCLIDTYINQSLISLRTDKHLCNEKFLFFNLMDRYNELRNLSDSNSSRGSLTCELMGKLPISLPPLQTQQKIAAILSAYDDLIEDNTRRIKILEEMAKVIYREWFVNFRFPGHEGVRMVESELGLVPDGWEVHKLSDFCRVGRGASPRPISDPRYIGGEIPWVKIADATASEGPFILHTKERITEEGKKHSVFLERGSLILSNSATCGVPIFLNIDACIHDGWLYFKNLRGISKFYLYFYFLENSERLVSIADGTTQKNLNTTTISNQKIITPNALILSTFDCTIQHLYEAIRIYCEINTNLRRTRDLLLPKLINGEIDVSGLDIRIPKAEA